MAEPATIGLEPLYDAIALGMWLYSRSAFRVETIGDLRPEPRLLVACTHRAESDVPVLCPSVYARCGYLFDRRAPRLAFAARDDMLDRGFFAGFPDGLPLPARRLLYPLRVGRILSRWVYPVPYLGVSSLRTGRALEALPAATPVDEVVPPSLGARFRARALEAGLGEPRTVGELMGGTYADILWTYCSREELSAPAFEPIWRERASAGATAIRRLIEHARTSEDMVFLFPEGRPSPDGSIGPLQPGLDLFLRRARPPAVVPMAIAYDRLSLGRPRAVVAFGPRLEQADGAVEEQILAGLRATMPLTAGQVGAHELLEAARAGRDTVFAADVVGEADAAVEDALSAGRPVEAALRDGRRRERLSEMLGALVRYRLVAAADRRVLSLDPEHVLGDPVVLRLAREFASARDLAHASL